MSNRKKSSKRARVVRSDEYKVETLKLADTVGVTAATPLTIGTRVTIGHRAMIHGCSIGDGSLIGMNAVVLNKAVIGKNCLIGANALVTEKMLVPDGSLVLGSPAKVIKPLGETALSMMDAGTQSYIDKFDVYTSGLRALADHN